MEIGRYIAINSIDSSSCCLVSFNGWCRLSLGRGRGHVHTRALRSTMYGIVYLNEVCG